jgi:DNA-binding transcriptional regulator LsrR (DeoR family)
MLSHAEARQHACQALALARQYQERGHEALAQQGLRQAAIARHLGLWRTSVRRVLAQQEGT